MCEMKNTLHGVYNKLVQEKKISKLEAKQYKTLKIKGK